MLSRRIIKLKFRKWWHGNNLFHFCACIIAGAALGAAIVYVLSIMLAPIIQTLNSH